MLAGNQGAARYNLYEYVYANGSEVKNRSQREPVIVDCLEDISKHPEKVQKFCNLVFTDEVKTAFIASLPRIEIEIAGKTKKVKTKIPDQTKKMVVEGKVRDVVIKKGGEVEEEVPATQTFIEYKGELYPEDWDGK